MFDADSSSFFLGDDASFQKKEAEVAKRLVCLMFHYIFSLWQYVETIMNLEDFSLTNYYFLNYRFEKMEPR